MALQRDRIQAPDRDAIMNGDCAGAVAGNADDQEPDVEEFAVGIDAELPVAGAGEAGRAVDATEREQGKARGPNGPGQHDMRTRRHDLSEDLTEGMGKRADGNVGDRCTGKVSGLKSRRRHAE
ncbi:hypothetical protein ACIBTZ_22405 [Micromonospora sp. NPDC049460]|uniref:hypothetical protein n=1 Tax=Micromonospora sp. NPDC049460 TaxID=3364272 RepID=UPI0037ACA1DA